MTEQRQPFVKGYLDRGSLTLGALKVRVRILETRTVYGRTEVLVEPVAGEGRTWVNERRVTR